jgi:hypothetical protein
VARVERFLKVACGVLVTSTLLGAAGCGGGFTTKTLTFTEGEGPVGMLDNTPKGADPESQPQPAPGSQWTFNEDLRDSDGKTVGSMNIACAATAPGKTGGEGQCTATAEVPGGMIAASSGGEVFGERTEGVVTGGTGEYAGASGSFTDMHDESGESTITFDLLLPKQ